jgi:hypothetical protein
MRGGNGPTRVIAMERISSPLSASLIASTAGLKARHARHQRYLPGAPSSRLFD